MRNFLNKEIKLCLSPVNYLFLIFTSMILIPSYPCYVPFFYICLSVFFIFNNSELNKDLAYSMILPITKKEIVKSRCILVSTYEIIAVLFTIPFALINLYVVKLPNEAGIDATVAFYGFCLITITVFNYIFFTSFYKKADKPGLPFLFASIGFWITYFIFEAPIWTKNIHNIEFFQLLDKTDIGSQLKQIPILIAGILVFSVGWIITYKVSSKRFQKVDL